MRFRDVLFSWLAVSFASVQLFGQAVVSTHSGVVNYSEGAVFVDDSPLNQQFGTFSSVKEGSVLRTEKGRAEVLLTPGVFLRIDENSAIRMVSTSLTNTRVEFQRGAAILDSNDAAPDNPCVLTYQTYELRFPKPGVYRINSEPAVFQTYTGEASIRTPGEPPKTVDESNQFFFGVGMETKKYGDGTVDAFSEWARNRAETIAADNRVGAQSTADPDPGNANNSPFALPPPSAADPGLGLGIGQPAYGNLGTAMYLDAYYRPWGPYGGLFNPPVLIYILPRLYDRNPIWGTLPRRRYPGLPPPVRPGYPVQNVYHPATISPLRSAYSAPRYSPARVGVAAPRMASPAAVRPLALPRR